MTRRSGIFSASSDTAYFLKAALVGLLVGGLATGFHAGLEFLFSQYASLRSSLGSGFLPYAVSIALSASCVTAAFLLVQRVAPEAAGSGIQEIEGAMEDKRPVHWPQVLIAKFFGGLLALGSGLVLGREGPTIHMGAMTAEALSRSHSMSSADHKGSSRRRGRRRTGSCIQRTAGRHFVHRRGNPPPVPVRLPDLHGGHHRVDPECRRDGAIDPDRASARR